MLSDAAQHAIRSVPCDRGAEWSPRRHWNVPGVPVAVALSVATAPAGEAVEAFVNEGRWVVCCPDCSGAQLACRTDPRFMCVECANVVLDGLWRPVVWPPDVQAIEEELTVRKLARNRNWLPGESVDDLRDERMAMEMPAFQQPQLPSPPAVRGRR